MKKQLKSIKNIFVRYRNPYQSLDKRFRTCEIKSKQFEDDIISAEENTTFLNLLKYIRATGLKKLNTVDNNILGLLDRFSDNQVTDEELNEFIEKIKQNNPKDIIDISYENRDTVTIQLKDKIIEAETLTHRYPKIAEFYPAVLTLDSRKGKCHQASLAIAQGLSDDCQIATGSFYTITPRARFLHSWVEENIDGETYCYDFTFNIALKKKNYYSLFHIIPYEKISSSQFRQDKELVARIVNKNELLEKEVLISYNRYLLIRASFW